MLLAVHGNLNFFMLGLGDGLVSDGREHTFMHTGIMMTIPFHELGHGLLRGIHCVLRLSGDHGNCRRGVLLRCGSEVSSSVLLARGSGSDECRQSTETCMQGRDDGDSGAGLFM